MSDKGFNKTMNGKASHNSRITKKNYFRHKIQTKTMFLRRKGQIYFINHKKFKHNNHFVSKTPVKNKQKKLNK